MTSGPSDTQSRSGGAGIPDIELVDVRRVYGSVTAVDGVSLQIARGEFFSLLGPSGCGKTTLLRMIGGFIEPTSGDVRIRGHIVNEVPPNRRATNMVFQQLALFPHLRVFDNVAFGPQVKHAAREDIRRRVDRALDQVGLSGYGARWPHELSGGQQQRIAIARALINEPAALLLDEPLGALDLKLRLQMQLELKAMQKRLGTTFVFVTHDQGEAMAMSDRIAVMQAGRVEQVGTPAEIYGAPRTRFVANFIGETNLLTGTVIASDRSTILVDTGGLEVRACGSSPVGTRITLSLRPEMIRIGGPAATMPDRREGIVRVTAQLGPVVRYEIAIGDRTLIAQVQADGSPIHSPGDRVSVAWNVERVVGLEDDPD